MKFPALVTFLLVNLVCLEIHAQGPFRRFGHALVERQPVRSTIRAVVQPVKTIVQAQPVRSVLRAATGYSRSYGSSGTTSYGSSGTSYQTSYGSTGTNSYGSSGTSYQTSYGSTGTSYTTYKTIKSTEPVCICGPNCQCNAGGTPCQCPKLASTTTANLTECKDCKTVGIEPPVMESTPLEYSGTEATDNFHRAFTTSLHEARKEGKIGRLNALALRGAMHIPSFQNKVKELTIQEAKKSGMIPLNASPEEVGKIDWSKIDWAAILKTILPMILALL